MEYLNYARYTGRMSNDHIGPDPVIEAYKKDIDRTLLREKLKLTVEARLPAQPGCTPRSPGRSAV